MKLTCRDAVLEAFDRLESRDRRKVFKVAEIVKEVLAVTKEFKVSTITTHITSRQCVQAPPNHFTRYEDLDRISRGEYRRRHG